MSTRPTSPALHLLLQGSDNSVGELLRSVTFVGEGYGCYENFNVRSDAFAWSQDQIREFYSQIEDDAQEVEFLAASGRAYSYQLGDGISIDCAWSWDGDGLLCFRVLSDGQVVRTIWNDDCKKDYCWKTDLQRY